MFRRRRAPGFGVILLAAQLMQTGIQHIPPITLGIIVLNTVVYLRLLTGLPTVRQACISYVHVWYGQEWRRIFLSPFFHLDDLHLYYNMVSFLWKGRSLETRLGSNGMLYLMSVFSILTSVTLLILDYSLSVLLNDLSYQHTCAAGFSGVIFALKVLTTYNLPSGSMTNVFLFNVPSRIAFWVELVIIQLLVPSASFTGHLAGIFVGLLYIKGPLKLMMDAVVRIFAVPTHSIRTRPSYTYNSGQSGRRRPPQAMTEEEDSELQAAIQESLNDVRQGSNELSSHSSSSMMDRSNIPNHEPSSEEIRQLRLRRFQR